VFDDHESPSAASFCGVLNTQRRLASTGSTMRLEAAIEIIGVSLRRDVDHRERVRGDRGTDQHTSTLSSVISLRMFFTAVVVSEASSRTMYLIFCRRSSAASDRTCCAPECRATPPDRLPTRYADLDVLRDVPRRRQRRPGGRPTAWW
jgi:hypothetical protein